MNKENLKVPEETIKQVVAWLQIYQNAEIDMKKLETDLFQCLQNSYGDGYLGARYLEKFCNWDDVDMELANILDGVFLKG